MNVLVTGATGHIGGNLVRALVARGQRVRVVDRQTGHSHVLAGLPGELVERVRADLRDPASLRAALEGVDVVFHLAAVISILGDRGGEVEAVNAEGVATLAAAARAAGVRRFVHMSSCHAFDMNAGRLDETSPGARPSDPAYNRSKRAGEEALLREVARGLDAVILNPTSVIGPADVRPSRAGRMLLQAFRGQMPVSLGGGFDWVDVRDLCATTLAAAERGRIGERYLVGGAWRSLTDVARVAAREAGARPPLAEAPLWLLRPGARLMDAWGRRTGREPLFTTESLDTVAAGAEVSSAKALRELGHTSRPLEDTVRDLCAFFRARGLLPTTPAA